MRIAVLCGGKGTRLGEPIKCLTPVAGRPFMDWKLEQLERCGAKQITLVCGPFMSEFFARYGSFCDYISDEQEGIPKALEAVNLLGFWTMGDVLLEEPLTIPVGPAMWVRRDPNPNIAGIYLDCGLYFGQSSFRLVETKTKPYHINTPADREVCDAFLRRQRVTR